MTKNIHDVRWPIGTLQPYSWLKSSPAHRTFVYHKATAGRGTKSQPRNKFERRLLRLWKPLEPSQPPAPPHGPTQEDWDPQQVLRGRPRQRREARKALAAQGLAGKRCFRSVLLCFILLLVLCCARDALVCVTCARCCYVSFHCSFAQDAKGATAKLHHCHARDGEE